MLEPSSSFPSSANPLPNNFPIISPHFSAPYDVDLSFIKNENFVVKDINGNIKFEVKSSTFSSNQVLVDASRNPIVTLRPKKLTAHDTWKVFRGERKKNFKDLMFTVKRSSTFEYKILDVFLANNTKHRICDFEFKGDWLTKSFAVYARGCSTLVAQIHKKTTDESVLNGKDNFILTVCPNVDYGFMVVLILILTSINYELETITKNLMKLGAENGVNLSST